MRNWWKESDIFWQQYIYTVQSLISMWTYNVDKIASCQLEAKVAARFSKRYNLNFFNQKINNKKIPYFSPIWYKESHILSLDHYFVHSNSIDKYLYYLFISLDKYLYYLFISLDEPKSILNLICMVSKA